jgi:hypothetical protein
MKIRRFVDDHRHHTNKEEKEQCDGLGSWSDTRCAAIGQAKTLLSDFCGSIGITDSLPPTPLCRM